MAQWAKQLLCKHDDSTPNSQLPERARCESMSLVRGAPKSGDRRIPSMRQEALQKLQGKENPHTLKHPCQADTT